MIKLEKNAEVVLTSDDVRRLLKYLSESSGAINRYAFGLREKLINNKKLEERYDSTVKEVEALSKEGEELFFLLF